MSKLRDALKAALGNGPITPAQRKTLQRLKARGVEQAWADHPGRAPDGSMDVAGVHVRSMVARTTDDGTVLVEVYVGDPDNGEPHYRLINPPTLVRDSTGDIQLGGIAYREDPIAAVGQLIARAGGTSRDKQRGGLRR